MSLTKIKQANKKWKKELRRKSKGKLLREATRKNKIIHSRSRKLYLEGQREARQQRKSELAYVDELTSKVLGG